jgi:hypothetical protein
LAVRQQTRPLGGPPELARSVPRARPSVSSRNAIISPSPAATALSSLRSSFLTKSFRFIPLLLVNHSCRREGDPMRTDRKSLVRLLANHFVRILVFSNSLIPRNTACRNRSSLVHSVNLTWQTIDGFTQRQRFISTAVNP